MPPRNRNKSGKAKAGDDRAPQGTPPGGPAASPESGSVDDAALIIVGSRCELVQKAIARKEQAKESDKVRTLEAGIVVEITEIGEGRRVKTRLLDGTEGWVSIAKETGEQILKLLPPTAAKAAEEAARIKAEEAAERKEATAAAVAAEHKAAEEVARLEAEAKAAEAHEKEATLAAERKAAEELIFLEKAKAPKAAEEAARLEADGKTKEAEEAHRVEQEANQELARLSAEKEALREEAYQAHVQAVLLEADRETAEGERVEALCEEAEIEAEGKAAEEAERKAASSFPPPNDGKKNPNEAEPEEEAEEFDIEIVKTADKQLGVDIDESSEIGIIIIHNIKPDGLVEEWNLSNPGSAVQELDRIVDVNGINQDVALMMKEFQQAGTLIIKVRRLPVLHQAQAQNGAKTNGGGSWWMSCCGTGGANERKAAA